MPFIPLKACVFSIAVDLDTMPCLAQSGCLTPTHERVSFVAFFALFVLFDRFQASCVGRFALD